MWQGVYCSTLQVDVWGNLENLALSADLSLPYCLSLCVSLCLSLSHAISLTVSLLSLTLSPPPLSVVFAVLARRTLTCQMFFRALSIIPVLQLAGRGVSGVSSASLLLVV